MQRLKQILVYLDIASERQKVLPAAAKLAKATGGTLKIVDIVKDLSAIHPRLSLPPWVLPGGIARENLASDRLSGLLAGFGLKVPANRVHLEKGEAGFAVPNSIDRKRSDLLVMGTLARTRVAGLFIGNTAERIVSRIDCCLFGVKPASFVSPVTS